MQSLGHVHKYISFHRFRYAHILNKLHKIASGDQHMLDIGPYYQTCLIRSVFPNLHLDTLGYDQEINDRKKDEKHYDLDLNFTQDFDTSLMPHRYDIILFSEVLEHLYTRPETIYSFLKKILKPEGILILQTPNAVALDKRIKILTGRNPFQWIENHRQNHFREYTRSELEISLRNEGFDIVESSISNYFSPDNSLAQKIYRISGPILHSSLRDGISILARLSK